MFKKISLELGGKNPNLIFADCDYERMLDTTVRSSFNNQGQICLCGSRIYVERSLYERFKRDFTDRVRALRAGATRLIRPVSSVRWYLRCTTTRY
jgi:aminomuconate-semialdehyde/2-hydroxymuconate-6-semialdehyde dehydrogenase